MNGLERSQAWWERAQRVIPLGTQTLSKSPTQFVQGVSPIYLERGLGAHVWDVDGNEYIDYPMGLGPVLLGYAEPAVDEAVRAQLGRGITFSLLHPLEVEVAERIVALCPGVEAVRFAKTGSDAVTGAVRAARFLTGRDHVLVGGYHGWHDWSIGTTTRNGGVPSSVAALSTTFAFNDLDDLERALQTAPAPVAAVVLEPSGAQVPAPGYLADLIELSHRSGALVVFDEVITGFRLAPGGARERYGVMPDFSCYGKALGNGMPISAVGGAWDVMRAFDEIFFSGTHGGEVLSLAAAAVVLDVVAQGEVLRHIETLGRRMLDGCAARITTAGVGDRVVVSGEPQRAVLSFPGDDGLVVKSWVQQCLIEAGVLFNGSMFICGRHTEADVDRALDAFSASFAPLAEGVDLADLLQGPVIAPVFRTP